VIDIRVPGTAILGAVATIILIGTLLSAFYSQSVKAEGTIYIKSDSSVDPPTVFIQRDGDIYTIKGNISASIEVQRNNTIIDGNGYTLQGNGTGRAIVSHNTNNVTIKSISDQHIDSFIVCKFSRGTYYDGLNDMAKYYTLATGIPMSAADLRKAGERIENLARLVNIREGIGTREHDTLPYKIMNVPLTDSVANGAVVNKEEFQLGLDDYYEVRGWTKEGIPTIEKLNDLGLQEFADIVKKGGA
jgi:aldehyde:ferredoxin oxidoreductase